jgi:hypothetical protein
MRGSMFSAFGNYPKCPSKGFKGRLRFMNRSRPLKPLEGEQTPAKSLEHASARIKRCFWPLE